MSYHRPLGQFPSDGSFTAPTLVVPNEPRLPPSLPQPPSTFATPGSLTPFSPTAPTPSAPPTYSASTSTAKSAIPGTLAPVAPSYTPSTSTAYTPRPLTTLPSWRAAFSRAIYNAANYVLVASTVGRVVSRSDQIAIYERSLRGLGAAAVRTSPVATDDSIFRWFDSVSSWSWLRSTVLPVGFRNALLSKLYAAGRLLPARASTPSVAAPRATPVPPLAPTSPPSLAPSLTTPGLRLPGQVAPAVPGTYTPVPLLPMPASPPSVTTPSTPYVPGPDGETVPMPVPSPTPGGTSIVPGSERQVPVPAMPPGYDPSMDIAPTLPSAPPEVSVTTTLTPIPEALPDWRKQIIRDIQSVRPDGSLIARILDAIGSVLGPAASEASDFFGRIFRGLMDPGVSDADAAKGLTDAYDRYQTYKPQFPAAVVEFFDPIAESAISKIPDDLKAPGQRARMLPSQGSEGGFPWKLAVIGGVVVIGGYLLTRKKSSPAPTPNRRRRSR